MSASDKQRAWHDRANAFAREAAGVVWADRQALTSPEAIGSSIHGDIVKLLRRAWDQGVRHGQNMSNDPGNAMPYCPGLPDNEEDAPSYSANDDAMMLDSEFARSFRKLGLDEIGTSVFRPFYALGISAVGYDMGADEIKYRAARAILEYSSQYSGRYGGISHNFYWMLRTEHRLYLKSRWSRQAVDTLIDLGLVAPLDRREPTSTTMVGLTETGFWTWIAIRNDPRLSERLGGWTLA